MQLLIAMETAVVHWELSKEEAKNAHSIVIDLISAKNMSLPVERAIHALSNVMRNRRACRERLSMAHKPLISLSFATWRIPAKMALTFDVVLATAWCNVMAKPAVKTGETSR